MQRAPRRIRPVSRRRIRLVPRIRWTAGRAGVRRVAAGCLAFAAFAAVAAVLTLGRPDRSVAVPPVDASAWLANPAVGSVSHVNALDGGADVELPFATGRLDVAQGAAGVLVSDPEHGLVHPIDRMRLAAGAAQGVDTGATPVLAGGSAYLVHPADGRVTVLTAPSFAPGGTLTVGGAVAATAVADDGTLWSAVPGLGALVPVRNGRVGPPVRVAAAGDALSVAVGAGTVLAVSPTTGGFRRITDGAAGPQRRLPAGRPPDGGPAGLLPSRTAPTGRPGGDALVAVRPGPRAELLRIRSDGSAVTVELPGAGDRLGTPVVHNGQIYVPDHATATLLRYDPGTGGIEPVVVSRQATPLDVFVHSGVLWANAAAAPDAVAVVDGEIRRVRKYDSDLPAPENRPAPATPTAAATVQPTPSRTAGPSTRPDPGQAAGSATGGAGPGPGGRGTSEPGGEPARCGSVLIADAVLDRDLRCPQAAAVAIAADGVTLDLRGHSITYTGAAGGVEPSVGVAIHDARDVSVRGGTVRGFGRQVSVEDAGGVTLADLRLGEGTGLAASRVEGLRADNVSYNGSAITRHPLSISQSTLTASRSTFIGGDGSCYASSCTFIDSTFTFRFFAVNASGLVLRRSGVWCQVCSVSEGGTVSATDGVIRRLNMPGGLPHITGNRIIDIGLRLGLNPSGPAAPGGATVSGNTVTGSSIVVTAQTAEPLTAVRITGNTVDGAPGDNFYSPGDGIHVDVPAGSGLLVAGNRTSNCLRYGIWAAAGSVRDGGGNTSVGAPCSGVVCG